MYFTRSSLKLSLTHKIKRSTVKHPNSRMLNEEELFKQNSQNSQYKTHTTRRSNS